MDELCSARSYEEVVRISAMLAQRVCGVDSLAVVFSSGEQFHYQPDGGLEKFALNVHAKVITQMSAWVLEAEQTAVVTDSEQDDRTRSHTNGTTPPRSLVVVPVGGVQPFAAITFSWQHEHWPAAAEVLVLEALARATALALTYRVGPTAAIDADVGSSIAEWLGRAADAEGLQGNERRHWLAVAELQHRVRNMLGLVRSIVRRTTEGTTSVQEYSTHLEGRISALARAQAFLMRQPGAGVDLEELLDAELIANAGRDSRVRSGGPPVRLRAKSAETLALAVHELAMNAVKFGALATPAGDITITWRREQDPEGARVRLEWVETGVTLARRPPAHRGFGRDLIERTVPYELRGAARLTFEPDGVRCVIDIPLTRDNVVAEPMAIE